MHNALFRSLEEDNRPRHVVELAVEQPLDHRCLLRGTKLDLAGLKIVLVRVIKYFSPPSWSDIKVRPKIDGLKTRVYKSRSQKSNLARGQWHWTRGRYELVTVYACSPASRADLCCVWAIVQVAVKLAELTEHLGCALCHGILRDAHTIPDCLHSCMLLVYSPIAWLYNCIILMIICAF
ncbi:hypothetical protein GQ600_2724 [Phytophthora cactorum]|nr:hypothetical protein GQ600_2724 [Phytophthora cactorum]